MSKPHIIIATALIGANGSVNQAAQKIKNQTPPPTATMGLQFYRTIIWPTLTSINVVDRDWAALLLGTAIAESNISSRTQKGDGPGLGVYQVEKRTHKDNWDNWLLNKQDPPVLKAIMNALTPSAVKALGQRPTKTTVASNIIILEAELQNNDVYATLMAYTWYRRRMGPKAPNRSLLGNLAVAWKIYYNITGAGTPKKFVARWQSFMGPVKVP